MISLTIRDTKAFMSHLLINETFDAFLLAEASISTANTYTINGEINRSFYTKEELEALPDQRYAIWKNIKPYCFQLIKGHKVPAGMKYIFVLSRERTCKLLEDGEFRFDISEINGLFLNIKYSENGVTLITGTSLRTFTLDHSLEQAFDHFVKDYLAQAGIAFEALV